MFSSPAGAAAASLAQPGMDIPTAQPTDAAAIHKEAVQLEGVFLNTLTSAMFSSIKTDGPFGGGFGEQTWRSMQAEQMANQISQSGGIGLADSITRSLLDVQEAARTTRTFNTQGAYPQ